MNIQEIMKRELASKKIFDLARMYSYEYIDGVDSMDTFPQKDALKLLSEFDESCWFHPFVLEFPS